MSAAAWLQLAVFLVLLLALSWPLAGWIHSVMQGRLRRFECANPPCPLLMVDDDADQRRILRPLLEAQGWDVTEASDGEEALARMQERLPEVILLDLMMPGMDGFAFAAMLRRNPIQQRWPAVARRSRVRHEHANNPHLIEPDATS